MSSYDASLFANELGAKLILPIHMDNNAYPTDIEYMKDNFEKFNINYKVLKIEETIHISTIIFERKIAFFYFIY